MEYSKQTLKLIARFIEDLRKNTIQKVARFAQRYFLHKLLKCFGREVLDGMTKEMDQLFSQTCSEPIFIKYLMVQDKRRAQGAIMIL